MDLHDAVRQIKMLWQIFAQGKGHLGLFLAAGCPFSVIENGTPLVPDVAGLTNLVEQKIKTTEHRLTYESLLARMSNGQPLAVFNVEDILSQIRTLLSITGLNVLDGISQKQLMDLERTICEEVVLQVSKDLPNNITPFSQLASWLAKIERESPLQIFTTNYDLLIEQSLERASIPYFDGFLGAHRAFFDLRAIEEEILPPRWTLLWKLHGSINWALKDGRVSRYPFTTIEPGAAHVIHPSHLKYDQSRRMPYLAMIDRVKAFMKRPSAVLVVLGYSFKDQHLNAVLDEALQSNRTSTAYSLMFDDLDKYPEAYQLALRNRNHVILARDSAVISGQFAKWQPMPSIESTIPKNSLKLVEGDSQDINPKIIEFCLGDFNNFGEFLESVAGDKDYSGAQ